MKVIANTIGIFFILLISSCSTNLIKSDWNEKETFVDTVLSKISQQKNTTKRSEILFLDSSLNGRQLNLKQQIQIYAYKSGIYCYHLQKPDSAKLYADSMLYILKDKNPQEYPNAYTYAYYTNGDALYANNQFNEAYTFYYKARAFNSTNKDYCSLKEYSYRVGMILFKQRKFKDAAKNFQQSLAESDLCEKGKIFSNYYRKQELQNNIALSYYMQGNYDSALTYYNRALDYISAHQKADSTTFFYDEMAKGVVYGNLGDIFKKRGDKEEAEKNYKKSVAINFNSGRETSDAQYSYLKLAELYEESARITDLENALKEIRISLNKTPNPKGEIKWHKLSWNYYELTDNPKNAYYHLSKYQNLTEEDEKINKKIYEVDINKQLELLEQENQLQIARQENEISRAYLIMSLAVLSFIILLSIVLARNWLLSKNHVKKLKELNETVHSQNEQLEIAMGALQKTLGEKDSILKLVAHDLRTPVASIPTMVEIIMSEDNEEQKKEYLEMIKSACNSSLTLIAEIMATADISSSNIEKEPTLLNEFINDCAAILDIKVKEKNQQLTVRYLENDISVPMNPEKMKRVVFNLVTNSVKFSKRDTSINLALSVKENHAIIEITDQGIGIPEKIIPEIFDISKSGKRKGTEGEKSYGLGLNICKKIVEAHSGKISVISEEGKGSTFTVALPLS
ncbi:tetratricopeptide repeat-containing sensor histidine kinase [Sediminibacterium sp.]|uniref:tetratricopeptide repeat-containing sensor histidine kinase n=1 Tax=Sediminibacterium sp. TaxID=1917865 RepID=UPI003F69753B